MSRIFGAPFATVPEWLLDSPVSDRAIRLWAVLDRHADADGRAFPGRPRLAARLGCGLSSLDRALAELVDSGAVTVQPHFRSDGSRGANSYWLWPTHPPVGGGLFTGEGTPCSPVKVPLVTQHAAVSNDSQSNDSQQQRQPEQSALPTMDCMADFDTFWKVYPSARGKGAARKAWPRAVAAAGGDVQRIISGAERYSADPNRVDSFTKHPSTWLNAEAWDDPPLPPRGGPKPANVRPVDQERQAPSGRVRL